MSFIESTRSQFNAVAEFVFSKLDLSAEEVVLNLHAEQSEFVRFNQSKVRQNTQVVQKEISLRYQHNQRTTTFSWQLTDDLKWNLSTVEDILQRARQEAAVLPVDPAYSPLEKYESSEQVLGETTPTLQTWWPELRSIISELDFVGLWCSGPLIRACATSLGTTHFFANHDFFFDFSLYTVNADGENKACKGFYCDDKFNLAKLVEQIADCQKLLPVLARKNQRVQKGEYRTYLSPAAVADFIGTMSWGGFSYDAYKAGFCGMQQLADGAQKLSSQFSLVENYTLGLSPRFSSRGNQLPERIEIVSQGQLKSLLTSQRSEKKYSVKGNQAADSEMLLSTEVAKGQLSKANVLNELETGLYLTQVHYLNWSDRYHGKITGMTRYAAFWVEKSEIVAPIYDLRFDESVYRVFGSQLLQLTDFTERSVSAATYDSRSTGGTVTPGDLVDNFRYVL